MTLYVKSFSGVNTLRDLLCAGQLRGTRVATVLIRDGDLLLLLLLLRASAG